MNLATLSAGGPTLLLLAFKFLDRFPQPRHHAAAQCRPPRRKSPDARPPAVPPPHRRWSARMPARWFRGIAAHSLGGPHQQLPSILQVEQARILVVRSRLASKRREIRVTGPLRVSPASDQGVDDQVPGNAKEPRRNFARSGSGRQRSIAEVTATNTSCANSRASASCSPLCRANSYTRGS